MDSNIVTLTVGPEIPRFVAVASGIISKRGEVTSHCTLLAREAGRPCVVEVANGVNTLIEAINDTIDGMQRTITKGPAKLTDVFEN